MTVDLVGGRLLLAAGLGTGTLSIVGPRIAAIGSSVPTGGAGGAVIDLTGLLVAPGLVDVQVNGGFGIDLATEPERMWDLGRRLPALGVTAFCPTLISSPPDRVRVALDALGRRPMGFEGAEPLGWHLEGPMLNPACAGAHPIDHLRPPTPALVDGWTRDAGVTVVTIAPELPDALDVVTTLADRGVVVSAGHTMASAAEAVAGIEAGVTMVTHLFNAMAPLGHRQPSLPGLALTDRRLVLGLIADGVHVDPRVVELAWRARGPYGLALVTDAVAPAGGPPGRHRLGDRELVVDGAAVRTPDGVLAGSTLTMDAAVRNLVAFTGCSPEAALRAAGAVPVAALGDGDRGVLELGRRADLVALDDELRVVLTIISGRVVHVTGEMAERVPLALRPEPSAP